MLSAGEAGLLFTAAGRARASLTFPRLLDAAVARLGGSVADLAPAGCCRVAFAVGVRDLTFFMTRSSLWLQLLRRFGVNSVYSI